MYSPAEVSITTRTTMEIEVDVESEEGITGTRRFTTKASSKKFYVMVDESKISETYLSRKKLPVEILPFLYEQTVSRIRVLCDNCEAREGCLYYFTGY